MPCRKADEEMDSGLSVSDRTAVEELLQDIAPDIVPIVERLKSNVRALATWTTAFYIPGDARGQGFGSTIIN